MTQKEIRKMFKSHGVQLGAGSMEMVYDRFRAITSRMAINCKNGNIKRLTPDLFWIALGKNYLEQ